MQNGALAHPKYNSRIEEVLTQRCCWRRGLCLCVHQEQSALFRRELGKMLPRRWTKRWRIWWRNEWCLGWRSESISASKYQPPCRECTNSWWRLNSRQAKKKSNVYTVWQFQKLRLISVIKKFFKEDFILHSHDWKRLNFWPTSAPQITMRGLDRCKSTRTLLPRRFECSRTVRNSLRSFRFPVIKFDEKRNFWASSPLAVKLQDPINEIKTLSDSFEL